VVQNNQIVTLIDIIGKSTQPVAEGLPDLADFTATIEVSNCHRCKSSHPIFLIPPIKEKIREAVQPWNT